MHVCTHLLALEMHHSHTAAGSVGVPVPKLMRMLGLDGKKYAKRMDVIASRLGLAQRDEQAGKIVMRHWTAPAAALQHHRAAQAPTPPSGGWLTAVQSAIEVCRACWRRLALHGMPVMK